VIDSIDSQLGFRVDAAEVANVDNTPNLSARRILCVNKKCRWMNRLGW
jgi:hypothetical protein